jgi:pimeloyl-ACP methyl ester carboxylesterase
MKPFSNSTIRKGARTMLIIFSILIIFILVLAGTLLVCSPGRVRPIADENGKPIEGSISEKIYVNINGSILGMFIKSKDAANPVLLYLHGGMPDYFLTKKYPTGLENLFTVVWWEQRGSGLSYKAGFPREKISLERMKSDTKEVTNYLRKRFDKEKIYLMGHSGGTFIGIQVAAESPELYNAYLGVAQMSNQLKSEALAYDYMLKKFRETGNTRYVRKLEAAPVTLKGGTPDAYRRLRDPAMHSLGIGTTHDMKSVITGIFLPSLLCREYTLCEKLDTWIGKSRSGISILWDEMQATDLSLKITTLTIPVYFFEGVYDYTCSSVEAKLYFDKLAAPVKGYYTFAKSAHSPLFEEPEKMQHIIKEDVLSGENRLADRTP